jgi:hypothetical protein
MTFAAPFLVAQKFKSRRCGVRAMARPRFSGGVRPPLGHVSFTLGKRQKKYKNMVICENEFSRPRLSRRFF